jgi:WW domain binding protein 11
MAKVKNDINPAMAAHKAAKAKAIKKGRAEVLSQRNERLAKQNPERLQRQIDELKSEQETGNLRPQDRARLDDLQKQLRAVNKAREALGDKAPQFRPLRRDDDGERGSLGKRKRDDGQRNRRDGQRNGRHGPGDESSETDDDVRDIPWPKDVENMPPPPRRNNHKNLSKTQPEQRTGPHPLPPRPDAPPAPAAKPATAGSHKTSYSGAAQIRDFHAESIAAFKPQKVKKPLVSQKLLEPEEADRVEARRQKVEAEEKEAEYNVMAGETVVGPADDVEEELRRIEQELDQVEAEDERVPAAGSVMQDLEGYVGEAVKEAEFRMMVEEAKGQTSPEMQEKRAEKELRRVIVEEVSDEEFAREEEE